MGQLGVAVERAVRVVLRHVMEGESVLPVLARVVGLLQLVLAALWVTEVQQQRDLTLGRLDVPTENTV